MIIFKPHKVLPIIAAYLPINPVIVEAGSFDGCDTHRMANMWPLGTVHAFEPLPELFERLKSSLGSLSNVICYPLALSNDNGLVPFYVAEKVNRPGVSCQAGSLRKPSDAIRETIRRSSIHFPHITMVPAITLDAWATLHKITKIDLLWLDLQGHELTVMQSGPVIMKTVSVVHTEVAFRERYAGQALYSQVKQWLESQGFSEIGVDFQDTDKQDFGNALFIKESCLISKSSI